MCLSIEYFNQREKALVKYRQLGYLSIDEYVDMYHISLKTLKEANIIKDETITSTIDIYPFTLTDQGRKYFEDGPNQLIVIKKDLINNLEEAISNPTQEVDEVTSDTLSMKDMFYVVGFSMTTITLMVFFLLYNA